MTISIRFVEMFRKSTAKQYFRVSVSWPSAHYYYSLSSTRSRLGHSLRRGMYPGCMDYPPITTFRKFTVSVAALVFVYRGHSVRPTAPRSFVRVSDKIPMKMLVSSISSGFGFRSCGACNVYRHRLCIILILTARNIAGTTMRFNYSVDQQIPLSQTQYTMKFDFPRNLFAPATRHWSGN